MICHKHKNLYFIINADCHDEGDIGLSDDDWIKDNQQESREQEERELGEELQDDNQADTDCVNGATGK